MAKAPKHPANLLAVVAILITLLAWLFSLIALALPAWSRQYGAFTLGPATSNGNGVLYSGLWSNCLQMKDNLETFVCQISDLDGKPASGDADCKGDLLVSRVLMCLGFAFFTFTLIAFVLLKRELWTPKKAKKLAFLSIGLACCSFVFVLIAWIFWIILAETACAGNAAIQGYSYSFILAVFASGLGLIAMVLGCLILMKSKAKVVKEVAYEYTAPPVYYTEMQYPANPAPAISYAPSAPSMSYAASAAAPYYSSTPVGPYVSGGQPQLW